MEEVVIKEVAKVVHEIKELKRQPRRDEALGLLRQLAVDTSQVLKRYHWRIKCLKEFFPKNAGLLGQNANRSHISIRLRPASDPASFYPYDHLLGTMVHEITHMKHSNHSAEFYETLDKLTIEVLADRSKPLVAPGKKLGGDQLSLGETNKKLEGLSQMERRRLAAEAATKRMQKLAVMGSGGGQRLGGDSKGLPVSRDEKRRIMLDAVDRRARDNIWCPSESQGDDDSDSYDYNDDGAAAAAATDVASFSTSSSSKSSSGGGSSSSSYKDLCRPCLGIGDGRRGEEHALEKQVRKVGGKKRPADDADFIDLVTPDASDDEGDNGRKGGRGGGNISGSARAADLDADRALAEALQKDMNNNEDRDRALAEVIQREINNPAVFGGAPPNS